jgi:osmotically-inducible protein OsmY
MANVRNEAYDREEQFNNGGRETRRRGAADQDRDPYSRREAYGGGGDVLFNASAEGREREPEQRFDDRYGRNERFDRGERFDRYDARDDRYGGGGMRDERYGGSSSGGLRGERYGGGSMGYERYGGGGQRDERYGMGMRDDRFEDEGWGRSGGRELQGGGGESYGRFGGGRESMRGRDLETWGRGGGQERDRGWQGESQGRSSGWYDESQGQGQGIRQGMRNVMREGREQAEGFLQNTLRRVQEFVGKGPKGFTRTDERILEEVHERLSYGYLDASEIEVTVKGGEVTLKGTVNSKQDRRIAEDAIEDVVGVKEVDNRLKVKRLEAGSSSSPSSSIMGATGTMQQARPGETDKDRDESSRIGGGTPPHKRS